MEEPALSEVEGAAFTPRMDLDFRLRLLVLSYYPAS